MTPTSITDKVVGKDVLGIQLDEIFNRFHSYVSSGQNGSDLEAAKRLALELYGNAKPALKNGIWADERALAPKEPGTPGYEEFICLDEFFNEYYVSGLFERISYIERIGAAYRFYKRVEELRKRMNGG